MSEPIHEDGYNHLNQGVKNWIEQDLKWKREEIGSINIKNEILPDGESIGEDGQKWAQWKQGKHHDVTVKNLTQEKQSQRFIRLDNGDWEKKGE